jgi:signal peptide peptidase SppA
MLHALRTSLPFLPNPPPVIPVVRLEGVIGRPGRVSRALSLTGVEDALERAFRTDGAPAVALVVNSPGGSPVQSRLIHERIRALAAKQEKRVFAFCEDLAASGGYMIALSADEVWADASSIVGSIGVIGASFGAHEAIAKLGVERRVHTSGKYKLRLDPFQPEKAEDVAWAEALQKDLHEEFIDLVRARRGGRLKNDESLFEGDVWPGRRAVELGVVDGVGHMREVLLERYGEAVVFKKIPAMQPPLVARLFNAGGDAVLEAVEERIAWSRFGL